MAEIRGQNTDNWYTRFGWEMDDIYKCLYIIENWAASQYRWTAIGGQVRFEWWEIYSWEKTMNEFISRGGFFRQTPCKKWCGWEGKKSRTKERTLLEKTKWKQETPAMQVLPHQGWWESAINPEWRIYWYYIRTVFLM